MSASGQKSRTKRNKIITSEWRSIIKKNSSRQKKIKTLSQEEITNLGNYLKLNDSQRNLLNSLNTMNDSNVIRQNLSVLEKQINKSSNPKVLNISKNTWRLTTLSKSRQRKFERQANFFFNTLDPNPSPKETRKAQSNGKQVSESLWIKILK